MGRNLLEMQLPGNRKWGRPKMRYLDAVKEDMQEVGEKEDEVFYRIIWRIHCGDGKDERRIRTCRT